MKIFFFRPINHALLTGALLFMLVAGASRLGAQPIDTASSPAVVPTAEPASPAPGKPTEEMVREAKGEGEPDFAGENTTSRRQVIAARAIAELQKQKQTRQHALSLSRIQNLQTYELNNIKGATEADAVKNGMVRALMNTASRLYFEDYIILGRDLLEPYLRVYGERFIVSTTVQQRRILAEGGNELDLKIGVNVDELYRDLNEKHFISKPQGRPIAAVVLRETIDGVESTEGKGRQILEQALRDVEMRVETVPRMGEFPLNTNAMENEALLLKARHEAQRGDIEVLITGKLDVKSRGQREILYDQFSFYNAAIELTMIRVDSGEILGTTSQNFASSAKSTGEALSLAFERLMPRTVEPLTENFLSKWRNTLLDVGDYRLMVTDVTQEELEGIFNLLKTLSPKVETYLKSFYGDVAVINVFYPGSSPREIEDFLRKARVPQFVVRAADTRRFELRVL